MIVKDYADLQFLQTLHIKRKCSGGELKLLGHVRIRDGEPRGSPKEPGQRHAPRSPILSCRVSAG